MQEYARQLRRERERHSWSQEQVAEKLGTTAPNVSRWERGKTFPDTYYRQKLCELFGKSPQELGLLQNDADKKREQSSTHPAVAQDSNAPVLGVSISLRNRNRQRMLAKVQAYWISGVLEQSLHSEAMIALGLHEQPGAIADPWTLMLNQQDQPARPLPPGKSISQVYDEMGGELLILGEPGSGKTTLLLMLTSDLLDRARKDETHPIPVVFNLSSWATRRQSLSAWLNEELHSKYQVPRKLAKAWIENEAVLPLLDGLDEVSLVHRIACVEAINRYRQEHGLVPMVICSRSNDYFVQAQRVLLRGAVVVQPLTEQQIEDYLLSGGEQLTAVRVALDQDAELQALATTPLMLSVLTLAYAGVPVEAVLDLNSSTTRQRQVFATYVQRMLQHRGTRARYTPQQTIRWLTYLAQQLAAHHQTELYLERIQPNWLSIGRLRKFHASPLFRLALGLVVGLIGGVLYGLICGVVMALVEAIVNQRYTGVPVLTGWWNSSISQVGLVIGVIGRLDSEIRPTEVLVWSWTGRGWRHVIYGLVGLLSGGFIAGASASWFELLHEQVFALSGNDVSVFAQVSMLSGPLVSGPVGVLIVGLVGGLVGLFLSGWSSTLLDKRVLIKPGDTTISATRCAYRSDQRDNRCTRRSTGFHSEYWSWAWSDRGHRRGSDWPVCRPVECQSRL